ncbi:MAG: molybdopterin-dependent oxidoreductase [Vicinamibacteria bacterium]|nr:molybdopterin-dependent oxidoreductase [Vicinamibacteria bacterium]
MSQPVRTSRRRREFLIATSAVAVQASLGAGCASRRTVVRGACHHDCADTCAWRTTVDDGRVVAFEGDPDHPFTRGRLCARMSGYPDDLVFSSHRLLYPQRRVGKKGEGRFERVSWDEALDDVARRLKAIVAEHGPTAVLPYSYAGTEGKIQGRALSDRFFVRLGASRLQRDICGSAAHSGLEAVLGTSTAMLPSDLAHSRLILVWGANPAVSNEHGWDFALEAKRQGARIVVVDPLRSRTVQDADQHVQPIPGTDAALALGLMQVIVAEGLHDADYVAKHTLGFDALRARLADFAPARVAAITGLAVEEIVALARAYATTRPAALRLMIGMEHHANGSSLYRALAGLPALVGAWRLRGGGLVEFSDAHFDGVLNRKAFDVGRQEDETIRSFNMVQLGQALTDKALAPPIHALFVYNSNPAAIAPNQNLVLRGLRREDLFTVVIEQQLTDSARHADYVFPATTQLEHLDLLTSWGHEYLSLNLPAIPPRGEARPNTEFFRGLAGRMGYTEPHLFETDEQMVKGLLDSRHPYLGGVTYDQLRERGWVRLAVPDPWLPFADGGFKTASGKCEFFSASLQAQGFDPLPGYVPPPPAGRYPLALLTTKSTRHFNNTSHAGEARPRRAEGEPRLQMHADDAAARGITDGDPVRVVNERGTMALRAAVKGGIRQGVVSLPQGYWPSLLPGGSSANALTPDGLSDRGGGGDFHDARVEVEKA